MNRLAMLLIPLVAMSIGCSLFKKKTKKYPWRHIERMTPGGHRVAFESQGTLSVDGPWRRTVEEVELEFDAAVDRAAGTLAATYKGPDKATWLAYAKVHRFRIVDNAVFIATDGQNAAGQHIPKLNKWGDLIWVVYYTRQPSSTGTVDWDPLSGLPPPWDKAVTPPWTVKENPSKKNNWRWGSISVPPLHTLTHELGHHQWANFQHKERGWDDAAHRRKP